MRTSADKAPWLGVPAAIHVEVSLAKAAEVTEPVSVCVYSFHVLAIDGTQVVWVPVEERTGWV